MRVLLWVSIFICSLYIAEAFPRKGSKDRGKESGKDYQDDGDVDSPDKEPVMIADDFGAEASDGDLSSTIEDTKAGTAMIENMIEKLKKMNKFLEGIVGYWDQEAAESGGAADNNEESDADTADGEESPNEVEEEPKDEGKEDAADEPADDDTEDAADDDKEETADEPTDEDKVEEADEPKDDDNDDAVDDDQEEAAEEPTDDAEEPKDDDDDAGEGDKEDDTDAAESKKKKKH